MDVNCSDCGGPCRDMTPAALRKGSSVREPGEGLCPGCSSRRILMVRQVEALPDNLPDIQAKRAVSIGAY